MLYFLRYGCQIHTVSIKNIHDHYLINFIVNLTKIDFLYIKNYILSLLSHKIVNKFI